MQAESAWLMRAVDAGEGGEQADAGESWLFCFAKPYFGSDTF